jgi:hypothetical protein
MFNLQREKIHTVIHIALRPGNMIIGSFIVKGNYLSCVSWNRGRQGDVSYLLSQMSDFAPPPPQFGMAGPRAHLPWESLLPTFSSSSMNSSDFKYKQAGT